MTIARSKLQNKMRSKLQSSKAVAVKVKAVKVKAVKVKAAKVKVAKVAVAAKVDLDSVVAVAVDKVAAAVVEGWAHSVNL